MCCLHKSELQRVQVKYRGKTEHLSQLDIISKATTLNYKQQCIH